MTHEVSGEGCLYRETKKKHSYYVLVPRSLVSGTLYTHTSPTLSLAKRPPCIIAYILLLRHIAQKPQLLWWYEMRGRS